MLLVVGEGRWAVGEEEMLQELVVGERRPAEVKMLPVLVVG